MSATTFSNHAPINFQNSETVASWDAGQDFGHHEAIIKKGSRYHLYESYNSGMCYGSHEPKTSRTYIFGCETREEMISFLRRKIAESPWVNDLLSDLGDPGDDA